MSVDGREFKQVIKAKHAETRRSFEKEMQQIGRCSHVVECAVRRLVRKPEMESERAKFAVVDLLSNEAARQAQRVNDTIRERGPVMCAECFVEEREVEPHVVSDDYGVADKFDEGPEYSLHAWRREDHRCRDARKEGDLRRDVDPGVDQGLKLTNAAAALIFRRSDLGYCAGFGRRTSCLDVNHAKRDIGEGST